MATIKVKLRPSTIASREGTIIYQIIHERTIRQLSTRLHLFPDEWDARRSIVRPSASHNRRNHTLAIQSTIQSDIRRLKRIIRQLHNDQIIYTADEIISAFISFINTYSLFRFMESVIRTLKQNGQIRTSETYTAALNSFRHFRNNADIFLDDLTHHVIDDYQAWMRQRGLIPNTLSFYNRILRAVYNRAVDLGAIENLRPFRHAYTGIDRTVKRALPLHIISQIKALDLTHHPRLNYARDMFLLSFMLRGMSFIDMAHLRKSNLIDGYITYRRRKTRQLLTIAWTRDMQAILDRYPAPREKYLLPILSSSHTHTYRNVSYAINRGLKTISAMIGISVPLTLYVARHSWASAAKAKGIPLHIISQGMGHTSEATTQIYLDTIDTSAVDRANTLILSSL